MTTRDTEGDVLRRVIGYIISLLYKHTSQTQFATLKHLWQVLPSRGFSQ